MNLMDLLLDIRYYVIFVGVVKCYLQFDFWDDFVVLSCWTTDWLINMNAVAVFSCMQISYLNALRFGLKRIFFGGFFIRGHAYTMDTISFAVHFWWGLFSFFFVQGLNFCLIQVRLIIDILFAWTLLLLGYFLFSWSTSLYIHHLRKKDFLVFTLVV
jgi:hypothetical protein